MKNCLISKISLEEGTKTSLLILIKHEKIEFQYSPFGFLIHGEIDEYYNLINIVRDKNVEMLENFFGICIEDIIEYISKDIEISSTYGIRKKIKNSLVYKQLSPCYFSTEALSFLTKINPENKNFTSGYNMFMHHLKQKDSEDYKKEDKKYLIDEAIIAYSVCHISDDRNMFKLLDINITFEKEIKELFYLLSNLQQLNTILLPNHKINTIQNNECFLLEYYQNNINVLLTHMQNKVNLFPYNEYNSEIIKEIRNYKLNNLK
ncbi:MAG: hypothetical protein M0R46_13240 [Candidatus Muirbacterium halophilum]|nr:hypothetical protein [Candidatus Muirbacterium halophilum]